MLLLALSAGTRTYSLWSSRRVVLRLVSFKTCLFLVLCPRDLSRLMLFSIRSFTVPTHALTERARVYSFLRSPCISIVVYSLHAQFQTKIPVYVVLFSKIRAFSNEMSKFPIAGYDAEVTGDHMHGLKAGKERQRNCIYRLCSHHWIG